MQTLLVIIVFSLAAGFIFKKFVWDSFSEKKQQKNKTNSTCGKSKCGCH